MKFNTSIRCFTAFFQPPAYAFKSLINILRQRSISQEMEIAAKTVKMHTLLFQREFFFPKGTRGEIHYNVEIIKSEMNNL